MPKNINPKNLTKNLIIAGLVFMVFISGLTIGVRLGERGVGSFASGLLGKGSTHNVTDFAEFWKAWDAVLARYDGEADTKKMLEGAIAGMVSSLGDPYTTYLSAEDAKMFEDDLSGTISGIGAEVGIKNGQITIIAPLEDSPAKAAGIKSGDVITMINEETTEGMSLEQAISKIRGEAGTKVVLKVQRAGAPKEFTITRKTFTVQNIKSEIKNKNVGYISISRFDDKTDAELRAVLERYKDQGIKKIVLDLRDNPGGYLDQAVKVASEFIPSGVVVSEKKIKNNTREHKYSATGDGVYVGDDLRLVVLVNGGSASASEIVAGAIQDHERGTLVGEKTFGKGSVQEMVRLFGGAELKVTIAHWFTPNGKNISKEGINPNVTAKLTEADYNASRDPQLAKALEILAK